MARRLRDLFGRRPEIHVTLVPEQNPIVEGLTARQLYATQANLHAVVSFLSDSVAQLPLKVYRRDGENDRQRDRESVVAKLLYRPNGDQTAYELWNAVTTELLLMGVATLWILPDANSESGYQLRVIPREWIVDTTCSTNYAADSIRITAGSGGYVEIPRTEFVQFRMYAPGNPGGYQSPISALRQTLKEQIEADKFRTSIWTSSGRFNAYLTRPANVQPWNEEQKKAFLTAFREGWGSDGSQAGKMPLLEDGMEIKPYQFSSKEAQYAEAKQLSREDVAAAYHVNPGLIWHTSTQTYASAKDNARALYADCLGPMIQMLQQRINAFLIPLVGGDPETYVEFDLTEKLKGSFEERASILQASVGGPWLTRNEARADNNLPPIDGGDELIVPLNVTAGGQASPQDTHMGQVSAEPVVKMISPAKLKERKEPVYRVKGRSDEEDDKAIEKCLHDFFERQAKSVLPKIGAKSVSWWDKERWNQELTEDLEPLIEAIADKHGMMTADILGTNYGMELTRSYLKKMTESRASAINDATLEKLLEALKALESPAEVFAKRAASDSAIFGRSLATTVSNWATVEAGRQAEKDGFHLKLMKEWIAGPNPRSAHAAMNGERVDLYSKFSNGGRWPGDYLLSPDESCNCNCDSELIAL